MKLPFAKPLLPKSRIFPAASRMAFFTTFFLLNIFIGFGQEPNYTHDVSESRNMDSFTVTAIDGLDPQAKLNRLIISVDTNPEGERFVLTFGNGIKRVGDNDGLIDFIPNQNNRLSNPLDLAINSEGKFFVATNESNRRFIRVYSPEGVYLGNEELGNGDYGSSGADRFKGPTGLAFDDDDNLYVADHYIGNDNPPRPSSIKIFSKDGSGSYKNNLINEFDNVQGAILNSPYRLAVNSQGHLYMAELGQNGNASVKILQLDDNFNPTQIDEIGGNEIGSPGSVIIDKFDNIFIADFGEDLDLARVLEATDDVDEFYEVFEIIKEGIANNIFKINVYNPNNTFRSEISPQIDFPVDLAISNCGTLYVNNAIFDGEIVERCVFGFCVQVPDISIDFDLEAYQRSSGYDTENPVIVYCPDDQEGNLTNGTFTLPDYRDLSEFSDNCDDDLEIVQDPPEGTSITQTTQVSIIAIDDNGNESEPCVFDVIIQEEENTAPVADDDEYEVDQDETLTVSEADGVLGNDTDADDDNLNATLEDDVSYGELTLNPDGSFTYEPNPGFFGEDSFAYRANDGDEDSNLATVTITVNEVIPPNTTPVAVDDNYETDQNETLTVSEADGVLANDTDPDDDNLTVSLETGTENGTVILDPDGSFSYEPDADFFGEDTFTYLANDGEDDSNLATVTITVNEVIPPNTTPVAVDDNYEVDQDEILTVSEADGVLENDTDEDGDVLVALIENDVSNGILNLNPDGSFRYEPNERFVGEDSFTYGANDGNGSADYATVTITVNSVVQPNTPPVAVNDEYNMDQDEVLNVVASGVLENDTDEDGDSLTANLEDGAENGTITLNSDGSFEYEPDTGFSGQDSFTYRANDGDEESNLATVSITVNSTDPTAPEINCLNHEIFLDENGQAILDPRDILDGEPGELILEVSQDTFNCADLGENTVILTATDPETDLSDTCVTEVLVIDAIDPVANCVASGREFQLQNGSVTISSSAIDLNSTDNCEITTTLSEDTFTTPGTKNIILYVEDAAGNTDQCSTSIEIIAEDEEPSEPEYTCIPEENIPDISLDENCDYEIPDYTNLIETENFIPEFEQTFEVFGESLNITIIITDSQNGEQVGICSFSVGIVDLTPPEITCPADQIENYNAEEGFEIPDYTGLANASDNCELEEVTQSPAQGEIINENTTIILTATDSAGNSDTCTFEVILSDDDTLRISCPIDQFVSPGEDCSFELGDYRDLAQTNFSGAILSQTPAPGTLISENTQVQLTASFDGQEDVCYLTAIPNDEVAPVANCVSEIRLSLVNGVANLTAAEVDNNSTDNCGISNLEINKTQFTSADIGENTVILTVTDSSGNTDSCETTVIVEGEDSNGDFQCRENLTLTLDENGAGVLSLTDLYTGDASGIQFEADQLEFNCANLGNNIVTLNYSGPIEGSCEINVLVEDDTPPVAQARDISLVLDENGFAEIAAEDMDDGSYDNCGEVTFSLSQTAFDCKFTGENVVEFTVTDSSGNSTTVNRVVFVNANPGVCSEIPGVETDYLFLYPNPTRGEFKIATPQGVTIERIIVFDNRGRYIGEKVFPENTIEYIMELEGVQESVYNVQLFTNEGQALKRIIIKQ